MVALRDIKSQLRVGNGLPAISKSMAVIDEVGQNAGIEWCSGVSFFRDNCLITPHFIG
jgi:hypothetical protein